MRRNVILTVLAVLLTAMSWVTSAQAGPYAPAAGQPGSTAIHKDDAAFVGWATGWQNYIVGTYDNSTTPVDSRWQTPEKALGKAVGDSYDIVTLGKGGSITLTFASGIGDGVGWDFAVFENSFNDTFLELGYVEVSSNGTDFFRMLNDSLTPGPIGAFGSVDSTNIDGLAGKYRQGYGTPFDLASLAGVSSFLDIHNILYVRIVDICGDGTYLDSSGNVIYDPYPTTGSPGFDLDAVGVLHAANPVPVPSAVWLLGTGLLALMGIPRREA
ncbi:MAG: PEP-CTERM sorting domain-containing protein [Deltaproteobacteria bacterium]|nr:PEP-CTERM sorting domain-containing protein [Deltaproteobacteria bacterium]